MKYQPVEQILTPLKAGFRDLMRRVVYLFLSKVRVQKFPSDALFTPNLHQKWTLLNKQFSTLLIKKHLKSFHRLGNHYLFKSLQVEV